MLITCRNGPSHCRFRRGNPWEFRLCTKIIFKGNNRMRFSYFEEGRASRFDKTFKHMNTHARSTYKYRTGNYYTLGSGNNRK